MRLVAGATSASYFRRLRCSRTRSGSSRTRTQTHVAARLSLRLALAAQCARRVDECAPTAARREHAAPDVTRRAPVFAPVARDCTQRRADHAAATCSHLSTECAAGERAMQNELTRLTSAAAQEFECIRRGRLYAHSSVICACATGSCTHLASPYKLINNAQVD